MVCGRVVTLKGIAVHPDASIRPGRLYRRLSHEDIQAFGPWSIVLKELSSRRKTVSRDSTGVQHIIQ